MDIKEIIKDRIEQIDQTNQYSQGIKQGLKEALAIISSRKICCSVVYGNGKDSGIKNFVKERDVFDVKLLNERQGDYYPVYLVKYYE